MTAFNKTNPGVKLIPLLLLLLTSCAQPQHQARPETGTGRPRIAETCWLLQPEVYRLRQSAELVYQDKKEIFEGFMELDLKQNRAHLIIFTALGVTLLDLEISRQDYNFPKRQAAPNPREEFFARAVASSVQHIFLDLKSFYKQKPGTQPLSIKIGDNPAKVAGLSPDRPHPDWDVTYMDYRQYPCGRLPQKIMLQSHKPNYKLTVWLHQARKVEDHDPSGN